MIWKNQPVQFGIGIALDARFRLEWWEKNESS
jgi:hypothetical protein